ncbi:MAG TPA: hypothetical protein VF756_18585 [Thermoanaerobaculia bacterium]
MSPLAPSPVTGRGGKETWISWLFLVLALLPGLKRPTTYEIEAAPGTVEIGAYRDEVDYV